MVEEGGRVDGGGVWWRGKLLSAGRERERKEKKKTCVQYVKEFCSAPLADAQQN